MPMKPNDARECGRLSVRLAHTRRISMSNKHPKTAKPTDADLAENPLIGGSKGVTRAGLTPDELADLQGESTIEGDVENDTNAQGGIDKAESRTGRASPRR